MKKRKYAIVVLVLAVVLISSGIGIFVCKKMSQIKKNKQEIENNIIEKHNQLENKINAFNEVRSKYFSEVNSNLYPESVETEYKNWIVILNEYTKKVDEFEEASAYLRENCVNKFYSNKDASNKCRAFVIEYETVINYYTKDIEAFNDNLDLYRTNNKINEEESEIKNYPLKYNYIDIDTDGEFKGKN